MSRTHEKLSRSLLRIALLRNGTAYEGARFRCYEWETETCFRVLVRINGESETDIDFDKVTRCYRVWTDGIEEGSPAWN